MFAMKFKRFRQPTIHHRRTCFYFTMSPNKKFNCTIEECNATFSKNSKLVIHIRTHTGERPFACDEPNCDKSYTNSSHLKRHKVVSHVGKESEPCVCKYEDCGATLANKYSLKKHYNSKHNPNKKYAFTCEECNQGFSRKRKLQEHSFVHTGKHPFACDKCEFTSAMFKNLHKHKTAHKTYKCQCGEIFYRWSLIYKHKKQCQKQELECKICKKKFKYPRNLKYHASIHMEKNKKLVYTCPFEKCKRFYFFKRNLVYHINIFHQKNKENDRLSCSYPGCDKTLKTKAILKRHLLNHVNRNPKKLVRSVRSDKGKSKKCMAAILTGVQVDQETHNAVIENLEKNNYEIMSDEKLLEHCDDVLSVLQNNL